MKILFIGSIPGHKPESGQKPLPEHDALFTAAREIGEKAAEKGHVILIGSDSKNTVDYYIAQGVMDYCRKNSGMQRQIEVHRPNDSKSPFVEDVPENLSIVRQYYHEDSSNPHKWIVTHVRALDSCDCIVTLGGGASTRIVGNIAADREMAIVAISSFGGTSAELFDRLQYVYKYKVKNKSVIQSIIRPWSADSAENVIAISEALTESGRKTPHLYFISYSWTNSAEADHVEALLRRNGRSVLRDENNVKTGGSLSGAIELLIKQSDTFLALWSDSYSRSSWCPQELEFAINKSSKNEKPTRVVVCALDDTSTPIRVTDTLRSQGQDRTQRELTILRLLKEEG
ncbi:MAG: toll/interleukin-1 receptor domain-containing protein [Rhodoferax sp.]|nr:toll/interleukin-1 receptor domain-containing protein [Rhodoferax sp.]